MTEHNEGKRHMFPSGNPRAMSRCIARDNIGKILENPRCSTPTPPFFFFRRTLRKISRRNREGGTTRVGRNKGGEEGEGGGPLSGAALDRGGAQSGSTRCTMTSKTGSWALWSPRCSHGTRVHPGGEGSF